MAMASKPSRRARKVTARIAGFRPGTSPPPVRMPMTPLLVLMLAMTQSLSRKSESAAKSKSNAGAEDGEELGEPRGMRGPGRRGDKVAVRDCFGHGEIDVGAAGACDVGADSVPSTAFPSFEDSSGREDLRGMANGGDWLFCFLKMVDDFDDT